MPSNVEPPTLESSLAELEGRVRALETAVAAIGDTRQIEERVTERVTAQVPKVSVASVVEALASEPLSPGVKSLIGAATQPSTLKQVAQSSWLAFDMVQELVAVARMLLDRRYHMAWITRILVVLLAIAILTSGWWCPFASWFSVLDKLFDLLLAGMLFLVVFCETRRYKEWRARALNP